MADTAEIQTTLTGEKTAEPRTRPDTMLYCSECEDWILRSRAFDHPHELNNPDASGNVLEQFANGDDGDGEDEDTVERVGGMYDITLSYSVDYRFRVPAWSEHEAKERAQELMLDAVPADRQLVHTRDREVSEIMSDDDRLPDDYDPYDGTPLWEVLD